MLRTSVSVVTLLVSVAALPVLADDTKPDATMKPAPSTESLTKAPTAPLDERIDPKKLSDAELPPLPHEVMLPMPVEHKIATNPKAVPISQAHWDKAHKAIERGLAYLLSQQDKDGAWLADATAAPTDQPEQLSPVNIAVTAMAVKAVNQLGNESNDAAVRRALDIIMAAREENGGFGGESLANYVNAAVVSALSTVDEFKYQLAKRDAVQWLVKEQWDQSEGVSAAQNWFGGAGYGGSGRPDLSNTQMMLDAMYDAGMSPDEPAFQKALAFVSRTQNLNATNPAEWSTDDGGFIYTSVGGGESLASEAAGEGRKGELIDGRPRSLRSYGSMTYAGFKSMMYAGLTPDDVRVRAAYDWVRKHFTFDENPGLDQTGLYYYYHTMARALLVAQQHTITDDAGKSHNWREELIDAIVSRQRDDGSWVNEKDRWMEGLPVMCTIYSLLSLEETLKPVLEVH